MKNKEQQRADIQQNIDEYGCHIVVIEATDYLPGFCYSIGLYQKYDHPEIICFGLQQEVTGALINDACARVKAGTFLQAYTPYSHFLKDYEVQFIPVEKDFYQNYLGYGGFFYDNFDFPAIQLVWPDKQHLYPWEREFNSAWRFKQPLLDRNTDFKFYEERNVAVFTTQEVLNGQPILYIFHDEDGEWQFHSEAEPDLAKAKIVCLEDITRLDPSVNQLFHLEYGQKGWRSGAGENWHWDGEVEV